MILLGQRQGRAPSTRTGALQKVFLTLACTGGLFAITLTALRKLVLSIQQEERDHRPDLHRGP